MGNNSHNSSNIISDSSFLIIKSLKIPIYLLVFFKNAHKEYSIPACYMQGCISSVNNNGSAADGDHNHAVGLTHRLIAKANAHDGIGA